MLMRDGQITAQRPSGSTSFLLRGFAGTTENLTVPSVVVWTPRYRVLPNLNANGGVTPQGLMTINRVMMEVHPTGYPSSVPAGR